MRIIGGDFKGKKIFLPKDKKTRPLRDFVKESIFNLIEYSNKFECSIVNSNILDLFSGNGSFGIECISRRAKMVTFIENYNNALDILYKNIHHLNLQKKTKILEKNCFDLCKFAKIFKTKFDIIFIDPPYQEEKIKTIIHSIKKMEILDKKGIIIIHRHIKDTNQISKMLKILDERQYGISKIIIGS